MNTNAHTPFGVSDYVCWLLYLAAVLVLGWYFSRREHSIHDYFLGGQRVRWWAAGLSIFGTQLSSITFMAIPAKVYATDWSYILVQATIILLAPVTIVVFLPFFRRTGIRTAYEYLGLRFNRAVRVLGSLVFCLIQFGRMAIVLFLPAMALSAVTGVSIVACILLMGLLGTVYTVQGGIEAVIWTDVLQVSILMGGALFCAGYLCFHTPGGLAGIVQGGWTAGKFHVFTWDWHITAGGAGVLLIGAFFSNLVPYSSDQTVVQRYLTTRSETQARAAIWTNALLIIPASLIFFFIGTALYMFYQANPAHLSASMKTDVILPWFIATELPAGAAGLVLAALFAAAMSSMDSSMNSMSAVLVMDLLDKNKPSYSEKRRLRLARWLTAVLGCAGTACALCLAFLPSSSQLSSYFLLFGNMRPFKH